MLKRVLALVLVLCAMLLCACVSQKPEADTSTVEDLDTVCFTDALSREVRVKRNPQRVAALLGSFAEVWVLSGGSLCAAAGDAWEDFGLELTDAVNLGGAHSPSLERLIAADPDLVIASASTASNVEMKDTLENLGITVAYFDVDHFEDYLHMLDICTEITGRRDLYAQNGTALRARIEQIKAAYANAPIPSEERKILLLRASSTTVKAKGSVGTVLGEMLADMGCINIADSDKSLLETLSVEAVMKENPYHIFVVTMGDHPEAAVASVNRLIKENPAWAGLGAVCEGRLHVMDRRLFNLKPNARWAEAYETLASILQQRA